MNENPESRAPTDTIVSVRLDGAFAEQVDLIAQRDGCSRSDVLRRLLLAKLDSEDPTVRWVRRLEAIESQLSDIGNLLEDEGASDAAEEIDDAVAAVGRAVDDLEDFEPEDD